MAAALAAVAMAGADTIKKQRLCPGAAPPNKIPSLHRKRQAYYINRPDPIRHIVLGFGDYLIVLRMDNSALKAVQFSGNIDRSRFETIGAICLDGKTE